MSPNLTSNFHPTFFEGLSGVSFFGFVKKSKKGAAIFLKGRWPVKYPLLGNTLCGN